MEQPLLTPSPLLIRADGSTNTGTGHVMRCLALAQGWNKSSGESVFVQAETTSSLRQRLEGEGCSVRTINAAPGSDDDACQTIEVSREIHAAWVVADGYLFGSRWQKLVKDAGLSLLVIDDYGHAEHYPADLILNQNLNAAAELYPSRAPDTKLLAGPRYALLRREFSNQIGHTHQMQAIGRNLLITLGGSDPENVTSLIVRSLREVKASNLQAVVVIGPANPHRKEIESLVGSLSMPVEIRSDVADMAPLMSSADLCIAAGGSTNWELAALGVPTLTVILAENQEAVATRLEKQGVTKNLGWHNRLTESAVASAIQSILQDVQARTSMSDHGRKLVDGRGVERVVTRLKAEQIFLRTMENSDCEQVWKWSNHPEVRQASFSQASIPWNEHIQWFEKRLQDPLTKFYHASIPERGAIGQIRFQIDGVEAFVSVCLTSGAQGRGLGAALIVRGLDKILRSTEVKVVHAFVKPENLASARAFQKAGFHECELTTSGAQPARHFVYRESVC